MAMSKECSTPRALRIETVRGDPISAGGRELIPIVRVVSFGKASAMVGTKQVSGRGGGFSWIKPLAVVEVTEAGEQRIELQDGSAAAVRGMLAAAISIGLACTAIRWLVRWKRRRG
jgi:uncharacterized spore protein YtfJ